MHTELPPECLRLLEDQEAVITIGQAVAAGMPAATVRYLVRAGRWQILYRGVYAAFTGKPTRLADLWAVVLRAGPEAVLSHQTAAELWGLHTSSGQAIHVMVPNDSNPVRRGRLPGVVVHRSRSLQRARHPTLKPPRTRVEDTVLDLVDCARSVDEGYDWICRAIGRRRTTAVRIRAALEARPRMRWRQETQMALGDAGSGVLSVLELLRIRRTSSGGIRTVIAGTRCTGGSTRSGSGRPI